MGVQDGLVQFLFDNTGDLYFGHGFEMLAALEANFKPATFLMPSPHCFLSLTTSRLRRAFMSSGLILRVISTICLGRWSVSLQFFRPCSSYGHFILVTKQSLTCLLQNRRTSPSPQLILLFRMHNSWMSFFFFGSNGNPGPITYDPLDTAYPPELSQVESIDDEYPPAQYDPPVDGVNPTLDSPIGNHMPDGTEDDSVSVSVG
jgi:hypothetical protein